VAINDVVVIGTGGTFDKVYDLKDEVMTFDGSTIVPRIIDSAYLRGCLFVDLLQVDSLKMTDDDRDKICDKIKSMKEKRFVIVHGTSKIITTALYLQNKIGNKIAVITGALKPYRYSRTEAAANLGGSVASVRMLESGVRIYMHGRLLFPDNCKKDPDTGIFGPSQAI
jgi:L-asparaginase